MFVARAPARSLLCALALAAASCDANLQLPKPPSSPEPGTLYGTIVVAQPGRASRAPVAGAEVWLLGTSLETKTGADGRFLLEGVVRQTGTLLVRLDADKDGTYERQRQIVLDGSGVGFGHQVSLGEVALAQNARVEGKALLADKLDKAGGHAGITVFVPEGPFLTTTADDGSWSLPELPEGPLQVAFLRPGYLPETVDGISLRGGEELTLRSLALTQQQGEVLDGALKGRVTLVPAASDGERISVTAVSPTGKLVAAVVNADGTFAIDGLPPGVYSIVVSRPGYDPARLPNMAVTSGEAVEMQAPVVLVKSKEPPPQCLENEACESPDPCRTAATRCVDGKSVCVVSESVVAPGTSCGRGRSCTADGRCVACEAGASCTPANRCNVGVMDCSTGEPACKDTGTPALAGMVCDKGKVCDGQGGCLACAVGQSCVPADACHVGAVACDAGMAECRDLGLLAPSGTRCGEDQVCNPDGQCVSCVSGAACNPANRCRIGEVSCETGAPRCVETGRAVAAGTSCGNDRVCDTTGSCVACEAGADCTPLDPCHVGRIACDSGAPVCVDTGVARPAGTACGLGFVCSSDGSCDSCQQGAQCQPSAACRRGTIACASGAPVCQPTTELALAGTQCGSNAVCSSAGDCNTCSEGEVCKPLDPCHVGQISCNTGTSRCVDIGRAAPAGTSCGNAKVCDPNGSCITCEAGAACTPADPCHRGRIACESGAPVCVDTGELRAAGTACGQDKVCAPDGKCSGCVAGASCTPQTACRQGQISCTSGQPVCQATSALAAAGSECGSNQVCTSAGSCATCVSGASCKPANACHVGQVACETGSPVCQDTQAAVSAGQSCGQDKVCNASGVCVACVAGASCTPANPCHRGQIACESGAPVCADGSENVADGTVCGTDKVCKAGSCNSCVQGASCTGTNPCKVARLDCSSGEGVCGDTEQNVADGTSCGSRTICKAGACVPSGLTISSGDGQTGLTGQLLQPVTLRYLDGAGSPVVNQTVTITPPPGGVAVPASGKTDLQGRLVVSLRLPRKAGSVSYSAATADGARATIGATATDPADGVIFTVVNTDHSSANDGSGGSALSSHMMQPRGIARASDGTLYVADGAAHLVRRITPEGAISTVAGNGSNGFSGDGGLATSAQLSQPTGVALDEQAGRLFVADSNNQRVRVVDLVAGTITTFAGGGSAPAPGYGDSGPAAAAVLDFPGLLAIGPDRALYVADVQHGKIRRIDLSSTIISTLTYGFGGNGNCQGVFQLGGCGSSRDWRSCSITWDAAGNAYFAQSVCGQVAGSNYTQAILKRSPQGQISYVGGRVNAGYADGASASNVTFSGPPVLAMDQAGNLYASDPDGHRVSRIEMATGRVQLLGGAGVADYAGDFVPMAQARFNQPSAILLDPAGNLVVSDTSNSCVRQAQKIGRSEAQAAQLSIMGGSGQTVMTGQLVPTPLSVRLADSQNVPLGGSKVAWRAVDAGGAIYASNAITNAQGVVSTSVRPGLRAGTWRFEASYTDLQGNLSDGSPATFSVTAVEPAAGTIFTALNTDHSPGNDTWPGAAALAHVGKLRKLAAGPDGSVYAADRDYNVVWKVSARGEVSLLAGTPGNSGFGGDGGPATRALLSQPNDVALSLDGSTLFIADVLNDRVRAVDLASGGISTVAGGGSAPAPGYGDNGPATAARTDRPSHIQVGPDGALYVSCVTQNRVRRVDLSTGIVQPFIDPVVSCTGGVQGLYNCYFYDDGSCSLSFDGQGNAYVSASVCNAAGNNAVPGIARRAPNGVMSWFAGTTGGSQADGTLLSQTSFPSPPITQWDGTKLFLVEPASHRIRVLDPQSGTVSRWAGSGSAGYAGDFVPVGQSVLSRPMDLVLLPAGGGRYVISDGDNAALRIVW